MQFYKEREKPKEEREIVSRGQFPKNIVKYNDTLRHIH